jgi:anaerobic selenocysteine-containing dehydrogenase
VVASEPPFACLTRSGESADPDLLARYPLHLITPPHPDLLNSTFGDLHQGTLGEVLIHPDDAAVWQVAEGEEVILENGRGRCPRRARVTGDTRPGLLVAEGLFWPIAEDDWGINELTSQKCGDMGGGATFHESLVRLAGKNPSGRPPLR